MSFRDLAFDSCLDKLNSFNAEAKSFFEPYKAKLGCEFKYDSLDRLDNFVFSEWTDRYSADSHRFICLNGRSNLTLFFNSFDDGFSFELFNSLMDSEKYITLNYFGGFYINDNVVRSLYFTVMDDIDFKDVVINTIGVYYANVISELFISRDDKVVCSSEVEALFGCNWFNKFFRD